MITIPLTPDQVAILNQISASKKILEDQESLILRFAIGQSGISPNDVLGVELKDGALIVTPKEN